MSPLRFFTAEDPDMALVRAIRRQVFVQDLGVPEQQEFDAADLPGADTVYVLLTAEGSPLGTGRLQGAAENYKIGRIARLEAVGFYEKLGFVPCGQPFVQRGMRHLPMELTGAALRRLLGENDHDEEEK